mgnify:CR=1 FL=1
MSSKNFNSKSVFALGLSPYFKIFELKEEELHLFQKLNILIFGFGEHVFELLGRKLFEGQFAEIGHFGDVSPGLGVGVAWN